MFSVNGKEHLFPVTNWAGVPSIVYGRAEADEI
jgi:hypothetical protein